MKKIFIYISILVGVFLALQVRSFKKVEFIIQRSEPANVLAELRVFQLANQQLRDQVEQQEKALADIRTKITNVAVEEEINRLRLIAGKESVSGEGVELTLSLPVKEFWISDLIAQLVSAGAEAVAVNDVRVLPTNAGFRTVAGGLLLGRHFIKPPLRISVIGSKQELKQAIGQNGGIIDRMQSAYPAMTILLAPRDKIVIPALEN